jgi:hypothetical protein
LLNIYPTIVAIPIGIATIVGYIFSGNAKAFLGSFQKKILKIAYSRWQRESDNYAEKKINSI